jgi:hypothetical protein
MSDVGPSIDADDEPIPAGWYPEPNNPSRKRYWDGESWGEVWRKPKGKPTGKANRLAVTALICSCVGPVFVGGILGTVFGMVALDEIEEAERTERGQGMAKWAIGLGFLNVLLSAAVVVLVIGLISR